MPKVTGKFQKQTLNPGLFEARAPALRLIYHFQRTFKHIIPSDLPVPRVSLCLTSLLVQMSHPTRKRSAPPSPFACPGPQATCKVSPPLAGVPRGVYSRLPFHSPLLKFTAQEGPTPSVQVRTPLRFLSQRAASGCWVLTEGLLHHRPSVSLGIFIWEERGVSSVSHMYTEQRMNITVNHGTEGNG